MKESGTPVVVPKLLLRGGSNGNAGIDEPQLALRPFSTPQMAKKVQREGFRACEIPFVLLCRK